MEESEKDEQFGLEALVLNNYDQAPTFSDDNVTCLLCETTFSVSNGYQEFARHLLLVHKLVISDIQLIASLKSYASYWHERFISRKPEDFCYVIETNTRNTDDIPSEQYYLLSDKLPEDRELRIRLQQQKLEEVLQIQIKEREDVSFNRQCLFCKQQFIGSRADLFNHMALDHGFNIGRPDNLVFTTELLDLLELKLKRCICLYCEKLFKDRATLREHMRKKQHKGIRPSNKLYDKYYVINYREFGKNWEVVAKEDADNVDDSDSSDAEDWSDWKEEADSRNSVVCLFCPSLADTSDDLRRHMKEVHTFDVDHLVQTLVLDFYQQVKLINYIRRQNHQKCCFICGQTYASQSEVLDHLVGSRHICQVPDKSLWDQPEYFFPTYENDNLLYLLDCDRHADAGDMKPDPSVIVEDLPPIDTQRLRDALQYLNSD